MLGKNKLTKFDSNYNDHLSNLDLINKYNFQEKKSIPSVKNVIVSFSMKAFLPFFYNKNKTEYDAEFQIKCLSLMYLLFSQAPYINYKKQLKKQKFSKTYENHYVLKITITKKQILNEVLAMIFSEQSGKISKPYFNFKNKNAPNSFIFGASIFLNNFFELETFFNTINVGFDAKDFFLNLKFQVLNPSGHESNKTLKNLPPFWILKN